MNLFRSAIAAAFCVAATAAVCALPHGLLMGGPVAATATSPAPITASEDAAVNVLTRDDSGRTRQAVRWEADTVTVRAFGPAADDRAVQRLRVTLRWIERRAGLRLVLTDAAEADIDVLMSRRAQPHALLDHQQGALESVQVRFDPTWDRHRWEEMLHAVGAYGDWGPDGSLLSSDQSATSPSRFDAWVVEALYSAEGLHESELRAQLREVAASN